MTAARFSDVLEYDFAPKNKESLEALAASRLSFGYGVWDSLLIRGLSQEKNSVISARFDALQRELFGKFSAASTQPCLFQSYSGSKAGQRQFYNCAGTFQQLADSLFFQHAKPYMSLKKKITKFTTTGI